MKKLFVFFFFIHHHSFALQKKKLPLPLSLRPNIQIAMTFNHQPSDLSYDERFSQLQEEFYEKVIETNARTDILLSQATDSPINKGCSHYVGHGYSRAGIMRLHHNEMDRMRTVLERKKMSLADSMKKRPANEGASQGEH